MTKSFNGSVTKEFYCTLATFVQAFLWESPGIFLCIPLVMYLATGHPVFLHRNRPHNSITAIAKPPEIRDTSVFGLSRPSVLPIMTPG